MNEIRCPKCGEVFQIDESNYESTVKQVRDHQFMEELRKRDQEYQEKLKKELELERTRTESQNQRALSEKQQEIITLKNQLQNKDQETRLLTKEAVDEIEARLQEKEKQISLLQSELKNKATENELNVSKALEKKNEEISQLKAGSEALKESYLKQLADKDELIAYYKDFKASDLDDEY